METVAHLLGVLGFVLGALLTTWRLLAPPAEPEGLLRAFKHLEADVDEMWEKVQSHLGRISRLKASRGNGSALAAPAGVPTTSPAPPGRAVTRSELLRRAKYATQP